ncbi:hypothetical protein MMC20_007808 [Loxospora ochrophaea]|nr:hypothetical protein [Loxospora ochrophaea]
MNLSQIEQDSTSSFFTVPEKEDSSPASQAQAQAQAQAQSREQPAGDLKAWSLTVPAPAVNCENDSEE